MLSGERPFSRGHAGRTLMSAILTADLPRPRHGGLSIASSVAIASSGGASRSQPDLRFHSAHDLAFALETVSRRDGTAEQRLRAEPSRAAHGPEGERFDSRSVRFRSRRSSPAYRLVARQVGTHHARTGVATVQPRSPTRPGRKRLRLSRQTADTASHRCSSACGSRDIYAQRVGGRNAARDRRRIQTRQESAPAFSPDGARIGLSRVSMRREAFSSPARPGSPARRLTDFGFDPAWSPDGKHPRASRTPRKSRDPSTPVVSQHALGRGRRRRYAAKQLAMGDAVQPSWSPSGERIAYWSNTGGQRDIYTDRRQPGGDAGRGRRRTRRDRPVRRSGRRTGGSCISRAIAAAR